MTTTMGMEEILEHLLVPDNSAIQQATMQIKIAFKDPNVIPELCRILSSSKSVQIRQYSAVLLRRKIQRRKIWKALPPGVTQSIRDNILQILLQEPEKLVRKSISQLIGTMAKHDLDDNSWPGLFQFIIERAQNSNALQREIALFLLQTVCAAADEQMKPHVSSLMKLLAPALDDTENIMVTYYAIQAISELAFLAASHSEVKMFQSVVPKIMTLTKVFIQKDDTQACEVMEFFDEILESQAGIVNPYIKNLIEFALIIAADKNISDQLRMKALSIVSAAVQNKKLILKHKLVEPILSVIFPIICSGKDEDDNIDAEDEVETSTPPAYSAQVVDVMALHLPPEKIIPAVMKMIQPAFSSSNPQERRAAFLTMAVTAEGCADYITSKHMEAVLDLVVKGVEDPEAVVRNAAMFTLGQFSEFLQPKITEYAAQLLPLLYKKITSAAQEMETNPSGITKTYYALEMFCENLGRGILPYLPGLMEHLMQVLQVATPHIKGLAISAIGATANAGKEEMKTYFPHVMAELEKHLTQNDDEEASRLQIIAIDTLTVFARQIGPETFLPLSQRCLEFAINLLQSSTDPDLKRCVYSLIAAVSSTSGSDMTPYLPIVVGHMLESLRSREGVKTHYSKDKNPIEDIFNQLAGEEEEELEDEDDDCDDDDDDEEEEDDINGISVENAYLDEKEDACMALGELALNTKGAFMPQIQECFTEVAAMLDYPTPDVKKAAMAAVVSFCIVVHKYIEGGENNITPDVTDALEAMLNTVLPKVIETVNTDPDREVVTECMDCLQRLVSELKTKALRNSQVIEQIIFCVKNILNHELPCQEQDDEGFDAGDNQAEYDGLLVESAGEVLPCIAEVIGGEMFLPVFKTTFLPLLVKKIKDDSPVHDRSFGYGIIADVVRTCGDSIATLVDTIYPIFQKGMRDTDDECRSNAIFGVGVLMSFSGPQYAAHYTEVLRQLFGLLNSSDNKPRVRDNICAAACRLVEANKAAVPLQQTISVIVQCLPLQEDFEENTTVYDCLMGLFYSEQSLLILKHLPQILNAVSRVLGTKEIEPDTEKLLVTFMQNLNKNYPSELKNVLTSLPQPSASKLNVCLGTV